MIPFLDLRLAYLELKTEIDSAVARVLDSGSYILGDEVQAFEEEFASYCEARHAIAVANGLDALHLSLRALGVGPGDEVIVPSNTFIATWLAVTQCGATPVPVEPDVLTYNIDANRVEAAITSRTKVIIPVHLFGQPADLDPILSNAREHGLAVLEDAAQAHGARYKGRRIGSHGDLVTWSFYPGKNLGALGDAGAITTNNSDLAEQLRMLRNYGSRIKYVHEVQGFNSRLDPIQAAVLRVKLKHLDSWNVRRLHVADAYFSALSATSFLFQHVPDWAHPVWHVFSVRHPRRDELKESLSAAGVTSLVHYPIPPHRQGAYEERGWNADSFPITSKLGDSLLSLPMGPHLSTADALLVADVLRRFDATG